MHGDGLARISDTLLRDEIARPVFRPPDGHWVRVIEGREVKPLGQNEHQRSELPSPPTTGLLWHPAQEFMSGAETRLKLRGNVRGLLESVSAIPVPLSAAVRRLPEWSNSR